MVLASWNGHKSLLVDFQTVRSHAVNCRDMSPLTNWNRAINEQPSTELLTDPNSFGYTQNVTN